MTALIDRHVLGRYRVLRKLAVGGMGVIYLGRGEGAAGFAKPVVIKRIEPAYMHTDDEAEAYFVNEAKILSQMRHPGIVGVIDFGRDSDGAYLMILEYVHGYTLMDWLRFHRIKDERFPADEAIHIVRCLLGALEYAHARGIIHRDVTPSNVLIDVDGHIKLADFGIASIRSAEQASSTRKVRGKLSYMAPELFSCGAASVASDVYSAALVLHELLVGTNEFRGADASATVERVMDHTPTKVSDHRDDVMASLDDVIGAALAKKPSSRYSSASALSEDLRWLQQAPDVDLERNLKQRVRADFEGKLPEVLELESLGARAAALSEPRQGDAPPPYAARGGWRGPALLAAVAVAVLAGGAFVLLGPSKREAEARPRFVIVERNTPTATLDTSPAEATPVPAPQATAPLPTPPAGPALASAEPARAARATSDEDRLTRAFASRRRAVEACFARHAVELSGRLRVEIRFRISASGEVESAAVEPADLGRTALGQCIVGIARSVRFGPQDAAVAFTIPVTVTTSRR